MGAWLLARAKPPQGHYNITMVKRSSDIVTFDSTFTHAKLTTLKIVLLPKVSPLKMRYSSAGKLNTR